MKKGGTWWPGRSRPLQPCAPRFSHSGVLGVSRAQRVSCPPCAPGGRQSNRVGAGAPGPLPSEREGRGAVPDQTKEGREEAATSPSFSPWALGNPCSLSGACQLFLEPFRLQLEERPFYFRFVWTPPFSLSTHLKLHPGACPWLDQPLLASRLPHHSWALPSSPDQETWQPSQNVTFPNRAS